MRNLAQHISNTAIDIVCAWGRVHMSNTVINICGCGAHMNTSTTTGWGGAAEGINEDQTNLLE